MSSARLAAVRFLSYTRIARLCAAALAVGAVTVALASVPAAGAAVHQSSVRIALIPQNGPVPPNGPDGIMPTSAYVSGRPNETFGRFSFSNLAPDQVTTSSLSQFDTVALIQVSTSSLSATAKAALAQFVAGGGKLIIHDSDETKLNDYSWLLPGPYSTRVGAGCQGCGGTSGTSTITNSSLISSNPADASYVNTADLMRFTDAIGDANLLVSTDPRWFAVATGTNANVHNESGAQVAFANNNGLIVYNGFDTDYVKTTPSDAWRCNDAASGYHCPPGSMPTVDWLAHMWYSELLQPWGSSSLQTGAPGTGAGAALPQAKSVARVGATLAASPAGLPTNLSCVARRRLYLRLQNLSHLRHRKVSQVEVFVNGKRRLRERGRPVNAMLTRLPARGAFTVEIVATTRQGYHLIAKRRYSAC